METTNEKVGAEQTTETEAKAEDKKQEEKQTADVKELQAELEKLKKALSKSNSEAAQYKRERNDLMDETKRKEVEREEKEAERDKLLATYMERDRISTYTSKLMKAGVDSATAEIMAKALPEGVSEDYFTATETFLSNQKKNLEAAALNKQPGLSVGMPPTSADAQKAEMNKRRERFGLPPL